MNEYDTLRRRRRLDVNKITAANAQLESAIWLWFTTDDPISVHTLTVAAHDCYHALSAHLGKPSFIGAYLKTQSKTFQKRAVAAQNFFKHGLKNMKGTVPIDTIATDALMLDCAFCHKDLQLEMTPLIQIFWFRMLIEAPDLLASVEDDAVFSEKLQGLSLHRMSRQEFLNEVLPLVETSLAKRRE